MTSIAFSSAVLQYIASSQLQLLNLVLKYIHLPMKQSKLIC